MKTKMLMVLLAIAMCLTGCDDANKANLVPTVSPPIDLGEGLQVVITSFSSKNPLSEMIVGQWEWKPSLPLGTQAFHISGTADFTVTNNGKEAVRLKTTMVQWRKDETEEIEIPPGKEVSSSTNANLSFKLQVLPPKKQQ